MSITQITREFLGLSSDTKPTDVATGSKFIELDTKKVFIFDGSSWYLNPMPVMVTDSLPTGSNIIGKVGIDSGNNGVSIIGSYANQFEQLTIDATAGGISLTFGTYGTNTNAYITVEGADIRFRVDGGAPTVTLGLLVKDGGIIKLDSLSDIQNFKAIRTSTTSATINCSYSA
ncbi:hypothetical protein [Dehalobacter sp. TBBPA1]|uniref:hypothetical protein n=1 Tax=Dehalobacter sp. TBBPA1 TaxID=3235037 RepID=UPI0034A34079